MFWDTMMPIRWWLVMNAEQRRRTPKEAVEWTDRVRRDARRTPRTRWMRTLLRRRR